MGRFGGGGGVAGLSIPECSLSELAGDLARILPLPLRGIERTFCAACRMIQHLR